MYKTYYTFNGMELELKRKLSQSDEETHCSVTSLKVPDPNDIVEYIAGEEDLTPTPRFVEKEKRIFEEGINVIKEVSYVKIKEIYPLDSEFRIFKEYNDEMKNSLCESIKGNGLFSPIIIWENVMGSYWVISGYERLKAYDFLYEEAVKMNDQAGMKKYETIPSFIMGLEEITSVNAKQIYLESNLCTRTIDGATRVKAYSQYYMLLKYFKERRNEYNLIDEMATKFRTSKQTICNYLKLSKLIEPLMFLFQEKVISFKSALKLSKFKPEIQQTIIDEIGLKNINNVRVKAINEKPIDEKDFLLNLKTVSEIKYPYWSFLKLKIPTKFINEFAPIIQKLIRQNAKYFLKVIFPKIRV